MKRTNKRKWLQPNPTSSRLTGDLIYQQKVPVSDLQVGVGLGGGGGVGGGACGESLSENNKGLTPTQRGRTVLTGVFFT